MELFLHFASSVGLCENIQKIASNLEVSDMEKKAHCRTAAWVSVLNPVPKSLQLRIIISLLPWESRYISGQFQATHPLVNWDKLTEAIGYDGFIYFTLHTSDF